MLIKDYPGVIAEQWVDPSFRTRWTVVKTPDESDQNLLHAPDAAPTSVRKQMQDLGEDDVLFTPTFTRKNGKSVRQVLVRVAHEGKSIGFVIASVDMQKLLDDMLEDQAGAGFGIIVADENEEVYTTGKAIENQGDWTTNAEVKTYGLTLQVRVWPEASLLTGNRATLFEISLAGGALIPKSGVKFVIFLQIGPKIDTCSQNLCSSRSNFTTVASAFQRFQLVNSTQYLLGLLSNEGRVD